ncbi:MAG: hypothetical protein IPP47_08575 [Bryobacterales bacterium]|nr:hypothetical protein [Bryobacterales bacterium]
MSPSGEKVALAGEPGGPGLRCKTGIFVAERGADKWAAAWCAPDNATAPTSVTWSPDEHSLAFSFGGQIYVLGAQERQARVLTEGDRARWAPEGDQIVVVRGDELWLVASSGAVPGRRLAHVEGLVGSGTEWSPDGQSISVVSKSASQPGDSRVRTELGLVQVQSSTRMALGVKLWGLAPNLRWVPRRAEEFGAFIESRSTLCGAVSQSAR